MISLPFRCIGPFVAILALPLLAFSQTAVRTTTAVGDSTTTTSTGVTRSSGAGIGEAPTRISSGRVIAPGTVVREAAPAGTVIVREPVRVGTTVVPGTVVTESGPIITGPLRSSTTGNTGSEAGLSGGVGIGDTPTTAPMRADPEEETVIVTPAVRSTIVPVPASTVTTTSEGEVISEPVTVVPAAPVRKETVTKTRKSKNRAGTTQTERVEKRRVETTDRDR